MAQKDNLGQLEHLVLLAVLHLGDGAYAVPVVDEIRERTGRKVARAQVYIALRRLESHGVVSSKLSEPVAERGGRPRRYFRVEPEGLALLQESRRSIDRMWAGLESLIEEQS